ncbi:hypothetical protein M3B74_02875 [Citrobacter freundii]|uniref:hypothetical protein n=1 Tax=Citrobacter freundii TaxID=546 RepID=UPI001BD0D1AB|nr:hypothetical protein [Citrobacter freundii]MCT1465830.1 hypothetical protein [Citrobacter freundii]MCT1493975.1 hypothetical protein [Citrobacter freundii]
MITPELVARSENQVNAGDGRAESVRVYSRDFRHYLLQGETNRKPVFSERQIQ